MFVFRFSNVNNIFIPKYHFQELIGVLRSIVFLDSSIISKFKKKLDFRTRGSTFEYKSITEGIILNMETCCAYEYDEI